MNRITYAVAGVFASAMVITQAMPGGLRIWNDAVYPPSAQGAMIYEVVAPSVECSPNAGYVVPAGTTISDPQQVRHMLDTKQIVFEFYPSVAAINVYNRSNCVIGPVFYAMYTKIYAPDGEQKIIFTDGPAGIPAGGKLQFMDKRQNCAQQFDLGVGSLSAHYAGFQEGLAANGTQNVPLCPPESSSSSSRSSSYSSHSSSYYSSLPCWYDCGGSSSSYSSMPCWYNCGGHSSSHSSSTHCGNNCGGCGNNCDFSPWWNGSAFIDSNAFTNVDSVINAISQNNSAIWQGNNSGWGSWQNAVVDPFALTNVDSQINAGSINNNNVYSGGGLGGWNSAGVDSTAFTNVDSQINAGSFNNTSVNQWGGGSQNAYVSPSAVTNVQSTIHAGSVNNSNVWQSGSGNWGSGCSGWGC